MNSMLDTPETKPSTAGGGLGKVLGMAGIGLAVVALGLAIVSPRRAARRAPADRAS